MEATTPEDKRFGTVLFHRGLDGELETWPSAYNQIEKGVPFDVIFTIEKYFNFLSPVDGNSSFKFTYKIVYLKRVSDKSSTYVTLDVNVE